MEKIYSKVEVGKLLHIVNRLDDIKEQKERRDLSYPQEFLQIATLKLDNLQTFKAHKHVYKNGLSRIIAQECWIVIKGCVKAFYYDLNNELINEFNLYPGDASVTFYGGHNYLALEQDTTIYEVKSGPYFGQELDKVFI